MLLLISVNGFSTIDNEYWGSVSFEKKIIKKTKLSLNLGYRFENIIENNYKYIQLGIKRKLPFRLKLEVGYRFTNKENFKREFRYTQRPFINLVKVFKLKKFKFTFRTKFQWDFKNQLSSKKSDLNDFVLRNKLKVARKILKKTYVFGVSELYSFNTAIFFEKYRFAGGVKYFFNKKIDLSLISLYEAEVFGYEKVWVVSLSYSHKLSLYL